MYTVEGGGVKGEGGGVDKWERVLRAVSRSCLKRCVIAPRAAGAFFCMCVYMYKDTYKDTYIYKDTYKDTYKELL